MSLLKDLPQIKLMILGSTFFGDAINENDFVRALKEKSQPISERLLFTGFVPYQLMPQYLHLADVAIIPSVWSGPFGLTVAEAQAMGLPTITTQQGGIPEIVSQENAVILSTGQCFANHLADAIRHLYNSPEQRANMAASALQNSTHYDKEYYSHQFFNAIESIS